MADNRTRQQIIDSINRITFVPGHGPELSKMTREELLKQEKYTEVMIKAMDDAFKEKDDDEEDDI